MTESTCTLSSVHNGDSYHLWVKPLSAPSPHLQGTKWLCKRVSFVPHRQPLKQVIHAVLWQPVSSNPHGTRRWVGVCECEQLFAFKCLYVSLQYLSRCPLLTDMFAAASVLQIITHSSVKPHMSYFLFHTQDTCLCAWVVFPPQTQLTLHDMSVGIEVSFRNKKPKHCKENQQFQISKLEYLEDLIAINTHC